MLRMIGSTLVALGMIVVLLPSSGCGVQQTEIITRPAPPQSPPNTSPATGTQEAEPDSAPKPAETTSKTVSAPQKERILFDGKSLEGWKASVFGGDGEVKLSNDSLSLGMGDPLTGVSYSGSDLPRNHYEVSLEARRVSGNDFFCCLTFPVDDSHCSLVVGGWAGSIVGLSCLDEKDAARNETMRNMGFADAQWYKIRVQVMPERICCWIDDEMVVDADTRGKKISLRNEVLLSRPLGVCNFQTVAEIRNIKLIELPVTENAPTAEKAK
jgi:Domain of Unknown Function (DUF1080)